MKNKIDTINYLKYYIFTGIFYRLFFDMNNIASDCIYYITIFLLSFLAHDLSWAIFIKGEL